MIVDDEAFEEPLDRAVVAEEAGERIGLGFEGRSGFVREVDRAVRRVLGDRDGPVRSTLTMRRHSFRLHFFRSRGQIHLVACSALDEHVNRARTCASS